MPQPQVLSQRPISRPQAPRRVRCRGSACIELVAADRRDPFSGPTSGPFSGAVADVLRRHQP